MEKTRDDLSDAAVLGKLPDPSLRMDDHPSDQRSSEPCAQKPWADREAASYPVQLSGDRDRYDVCAASVHDPFCLFQCGETGLVARRGGKRSRSEPV